MESSSIIFRTYLLSSLTPPGFRGEQKESYLDTDENTSAFRLSLLPGIHHWLQQQSKCNAIWGSRFTNIEAQASPLAAEVNRTLHRAPFVNPTKVYQAPTVSTPGEVKGKPLQYSCLGNPMDRGAWWDTVHGSQKVRHDWVTKQQQYLHIKQWGSREWDGHHAQLCGAHSLKGNYCYQRGAMGASKVGMELNLYHPWLSTDLECFTVL